MSGFIQISIRELPTWIKVLKKDPNMKTAEDILKELTLIDDLLVLQKSKSLLTRKRGLKDQLEARIAKELGFTTPNLSVRK